MRFLLSLISIFILSACSKAPNYHLLYPIEASHQKVSRLQGYRFLSTELSSPASIIILSNPVENGGFVDLAFALSNHSSKPIHLDAKDFVFKLSKIGNVQLFTKEEYLHASEYTKPKAFKDLTPKMQAYGCVGSNTKDNISTDEFTPTQAWVWQRHLQYPFKRSELYFESLDLKPQETKGVIWRLKIPKLEEGFEQGTLFIKFDLNEEAYRFKFILQSLAQDEKTAK